MHPIVAETTGFVQPVLTNFYKISVLSVPTTVNKYEHSIGTHGPAHAIPVECGVHYRLEAWIVKRAHSTIDKLTSDRIFPGSSKNLYLLWFKVTGSCS
jgi:hypothetical protein